MAKTITINGKFLGASAKGAGFTGVHRVAIEIVNALAALEAAGEEDIACELLLPHDATRNADTVAMRKRVVRPLRHIPWEQLTLPFNHGGNTLLNLCNLGPVLSRNAFTMVHDAQVYTTPASYSFGFRAWYKTLLPIIGRRHRRILTVSDYARRQIAGAGIAAIEKIDVVHNGGDHVLRVAPDMGIAARLGLDGQPFVAALANVQPHKNISLLLQAFAHPDLADQTLVLFGPARREDFARGGKEVPPNVLFAGRVSDAELGGLLVRALCLAFPSTTEGFGLPVLEAMTLGCPVIAAPCGAVPEICGDAAIYAPPDEADAWREAILSLEMQPERAAGLSDAGKIRAAEFTWRNAAIRIAQIIRTAG